MATNRIKDNNGYIEIPRNPISKSGVFPYAAKPFGVTDKSIVYIYRPESELASQATMDSLKLMPLIDDHEMLGDHATPAEQKGVHGVVGEHIAFDSGILYGNLKIYSNSLMDSVDRKGKRELSAGMRSFIDWSPGTINGQQYDGIQKQIRFNHVALVSKGRMGSDVRVLDAADSYEFMDVMDIDETCAQTYTEPPGHIELLQKIKDLITQFYGQEINETMPANITDNNNLTNNTGTPMDNIEDNAQQENANTVTTDSATEQPVINAGVTTTNNVVTSPNIVTSHNVVTMDKDELRALIKEETEKLFTDYKDQSAQIADLYAKAKPFVGVFDYAHMSLEQTGVYIAEKLGLTPTSGQVLPMLDGYFAAAQPNKQAYIVNATKQNSNASTLTLKDLAGV